MPLRFSTISCVTGGFDDGMLSVSSSVSSSRGVSGSWAVGVVVSVSAGVSSVSGVSSMFSGLVRASWAAGVMLSAILITMGMRVCVRVLMYFSSASFDRTVVM